MVKYLLSTDGVLIVIADMSIFRYRNGRTERVARAYNREGHAKVTNMKRDFQLAIDRALENIYYEILHEQGLQESNNYNYDYFFEHRIKDYDIDYETFGNKREHWSYRQNRETGKVDIYYNNEYDSSEPYDYVEHERIESISRDKDSKRTEYEEISTKKREKYKRY